MRLTRFAICLVGFATSASAQAHTIVALSHSDHTVNELDPVSGKVLHKFTAADQPHEGVASPDGKTFYAAVPNGPHVVILETAGFTETGRIESPFFKSSRANGSASPHGVALTGDGSKLYVALSGSPLAPPGVDESTLPPPDKTADGVGVIDVSGRSLLQILRGVSDPEQLALDHSGERVFIASEDTGTVVVLGAKDGARLKDVPVDIEPRFATADELLR